MTYIAFIINSSAIEIKRSVLRTITNQFSFKLIIFENRVGNISVIKTF